MLSYFCFLWLSKSLNSFNTLKSPSLKSNASIIRRYIYSHFCYSYIITIVDGYDNYTMLMAKWLGLASLQLLAACLLSSLFGIPISALNKVTKSTV